jgi:hypothetical protein
MLQSTNVKKRRTAKTALLTALFMTVALFIPAASASPIYKTGGSSISFSPADFTNVLNDIDRRLAGIFITKLPESGLLTYAGRILYEGEAVTTETIGLLRYEASGNIGRTTEFSFMPIYGDGSVESAVTVSLTLRELENKPPTVSDVEVKTVKDVSVIGIFRGIDPEGDSMTFRLTSKPRRGEVEVLADGSFKYTPFRKKTGSDSFNYVAVDSYGNVSKEAKARVVIEKPSTKTTYADMSGHPAHYAALRLCGEGIFTGSVIDGRHYFKPDESVSRAEMITMVVRALGLEVSPVSVTGFNDDASLPAWFKPYAQAAFKAGLISGMRMPDGRVVIKADELATLRQAAALINNALRPVNVPLGDDIAVPVWSAQAVANLNSVGVLDGVVESAGESPLTRGEMAVLLVRAMDAVVSSQEKNGLLSWVFGW